MKKSIYQKYLDGDRLTDKDIIEGHKKFLEAWLALSGLGQAFRITANELCRVALAFEGYGKARNLKEFK